MSFKICYQLKNLIVIFKYKVAVYLDLSNIILLSKSPCVDGALFTINLENMYAAAPKAYWRQLKNNKSNDMRTVNTKSSYINKARHKKRLFQTF